MYNINSSSGIFQFEKGGQVILNERYRIISTLSRHPGSTVWLVEHQKLGVKRIIKGIPKSSPYHRELAEEAHLLINLNHPCIPAIYDLEEDDDFIYIIEQYIEGQSLGERCKVGLLSEEEFFHYFTCIASAVDYMHEGPEEILYLDLKPENIVVQGKKAYLVDFGSAGYRSAFADSDKKPQPVFGSRLYAAPEQLQGQGLGRETDIYALGGLLFFMIAHSLLSPRAAAEAKRVAGLCVSRHKYRRIRSAKAVAAQLVQINKREERVSENQTGLTKQTVKIAVFGSHSRSGVTHTAVTLASYLALKRGYKICLFDKAGSKDFYSLKERQAWVSPGACGSFFLNGVCYLSTEDSRSVSALGEDFDCIIYDMGHDLKDLQAIADYCDLIIFTETYAPWHKLPDSERFIQVPELAVGKSLFLLNLADNKNLRDLKGIGIPALALPYEDDPFDPGKGSCRTMEKVTDWFLE